MLKLLIPINYFAEGQWLASIILSDHLGLSFAVEETKDSRFTLKNIDCALFLPNFFFAQAVNAWLSSSTLPRLPLVQWHVSASDLDVDLVENSIPVLFGRPGFHLDESGNGHLNLDIFGSAFFMLSRYEEAVSTIRDVHDRFPATASIAYQVGFLDRPIIDEYVEILWAAMKRVWPGLERKPRLSRTLVSCDVDSPYAFNGSLKGMALRCAGDLLKRRSPTLARQNLAGNMRVRHGDYSQDPHLQAIDWIMDVNERAGNRVAFYFIPDRSHPTLDGNYCLDEPVIRALLRRIHERGHEIGLHASYNTHRDAAQTRHEADILRRTLETESIHQDEIGGRQHFTLADTNHRTQLEAAGMAYDSTLTHADQPGFRCGTSREYPMYDVVERCPLTLRQRPLIVMECSVIAERYLGLGYTDQALDLMLTLKRRALRYGGDFTPLWHNSHFNQPKDREFYQALIK